MQSIREGKTVVSKKKTKADANDAPRPDVVHPDQVGSVFDTVTDDILREIFSHLDSKALSAARLVSSKFNRAMQYNGIFWKGYEAKNPLTKIVNNEEKIMLILKSFQGGISPSLDYDFIWSLLISNLNLKLFDKIINQILKNERVSSEFYEFVKDEYANDSKIATYKSRGFTILFWSLLLNRPNEAKKFLKLNAPLMREGNSRFLISHAALNEARNWLLEIAIANELTQLLEILLEHGGNSNFTNGGFSALQFAAKKGNLDCVKVLLKYKAEINFLSPTGSTPLMWAIMENHIEIVRYLIQNGADCSLKNSKSPEGSLLHLAIERSSKFPDAHKMIDLVLAHTENLDALDQYGQSALLKAVGFFLQKTVLDLLKCGANVNIANKSKMTPLILAARDFNFQAAVVLLEYGADINAKSSRGATALHYAADSNREEMIALLIKYNADPNIADAERRTPLWIAAMTGRMQNITALVNAGAKVDTKRLTLKEYLCFQAKNKPQLVKDNIENYFKAIGKDEAEIDAYTVASLMGNTEAAAFIQDKLIEPKLLEAKPIQPDDQAFESIAKKLKQA